MKLYIWTDRLSYLAIAHTTDVAAARKLMLETSDIGESGDGSCPERDRARKTILEETPAVYYGEIAEFSLSDSAELREQEKYSEALYQQTTAKDRRIAELEAALNKYGDHVVPCPAWNGEGECSCGFVDIKTPVLDAALAAAKRQALEEAARRYEVEGMTPYSRTHVAAFLRRMAREVKP